MSDLCSMILHIKSAPLGNPNTNVILNQLICQLMLENTHIHLRGFNDNAVISNIA